MRRRAVLLVPERTNPLPNHRRHVALVFALAVFTAVGGLGAKAWHDLADPIEDARLFLADYDELAHNPNAAMTYPEAKNGGLLTRRTELGDEIARMKRLLPKDHNWTVTLLGHMESKGFKPDRAVASCVGTSRLQRVLRKLPFLSKVTFRENDYVIIELAPGRAYATESERDAAPPMREPWTTAALSSSGRIYPYALPATDAALPFTPFTPLVPARPSAAPGAAVPNGATSGATPALSAPPGTARPSTASLAVAPLAVAPPLAARPGIPRCGTAPYALLARLFRNELRRHEHQLVRERCPALVQPVVSRLHRAVRVGL